MSRIAFSFAIIPPFILLIILSILDLPRLLLTLIRVLRVRASIAVYVATRPAIRARAGYFGAREGQFIKEQGFPRQITRWLLRAAVESEYVKTRLGELRASIADGNYPEPYTCGHPDIVSDILDALLWSPTDLDARNYIVYICVTGQAFHSAELPHFRLDSTCACEACDVYFKWLAETPVPSTFDPATFEPYAPTSDGDK